MTRFLLLFSLFTSLTSHSQLEIPTQNGLVVFSLVDSAGAKAYANAKTWAATNLTNSNYAIKMDDQANGKLIIKASAVLKGEFLMAIEHCDFTIDFTFKPNKYRVQIFDISGYPIPIESLRVSAESLLSRFKNNEYPSKSKKEVKYQQQQKEKDETNLAAINRYFTDLLARIEKAVSTDDDF